MFYKKGVLKDFAKFTEKHLCLGLFVLMKLHGEICNFIKKRDSATGVFLWIYEIFKKILLTQHLRVTASGVERYGFSLQIYHFLNILFTYATKVWL